MTLVVTQSRTSCGGIVYCDVWRLRTFRALSGRRPIATEIAFGVRQLQVLQGFDSVLPRGRTGLSESSVHQHNLHQQ